MIDMRPSRWDWPRILFARSAPIVLGIAAALSILGIALIYFDFSPTSPVGQMLIDIGAVPAAFGLFALWIPMGFFWLMCDRSPQWIRAIWFFLLLFGMVFGAIPYYLLVYLPAVRKHRSGEVDIARTYPRLVSQQPIVIGWFGKSLIACWALLFLTVAAVFMFPKGMSGVLHPIADYFVLWPLTLLVATGIYGIRLALRVALRRD
ncbi:MAG TPA: hypothetical protein VGJ21_15180 [Terracidiphilus sp.]|jgi:hypothetical protein